MGKVKFTPSAKSDMSEIDSHIIEHLGFDLADKLLETFQNAFMLILENLEIGRERPVHLPANQTFHYLPFSCCMLLL
jgi:plasmid stabilization system protein ParE